MPEHPLAARVYHRAHAALEQSRLQPARQHLLASASGRVLEVRAGVGENLAWYPDSVVHVDLCETDRTKRRRLKHRLAARDWPFTVAVHPVDAFGPFPAADYDVVVAMVVLSSCAEPEASAIATALRGALTPSGRLYYLDFAQAGGWAGRLQSAVSPWFRRLPGGPHLDHPATAALRAAGLVPIEQCWHRLPPPWCLAVEGQAIVRVRPDNRSS